MLGRNGYAPSYFGVVDASLTKRYSCSMSHDILVRQTSEKDLPAITAIYAEAVHAGAGSFELKAPDATEMTRRWRNRVTKGYPHIVAVRDDAVVGYAYASRFRTSPAYRFMVEDSIYIAADAQRSGLGRALLTELIKLCEGLGYRQMIALIAGPTENPASIGLHDRLGFRRIGLIEGSAFKHDRWIDTLLMLRALGDGSASAPREDKLVPEQSARQKPERSRGALKAANMKSRSKG